MHPASQMPVFIGIAPRTAQRTFSGDFDGKGGKPTLQDASPRLQSFAGSHRAPFGGDCYWAGDLADKSNLPHQPGLNTFIFFC